MCHFQIKNSNTGQNYIGTKNMQNTWSEQNK